MKTLKNFLEQHDACSDGYDFAKDLTLEQFLNTCERGDWILWLFARTNPADLKKLTEAKAHCANTVRHLMKDARTTNAIDVALKFANNEATVEQLESAFTDAAAASAEEACAGAIAAYAAYAADAAAFAAARENNRKLKASICKEVLPLSIWDRSKF